MDSLPSPAQELVLIDRELARLDARRSWLLARRTWLLGVLRAEGAQAPGAPGWGGAAAAGAAAWGGRAVRRRRGGAHAAADAGRDAAGGRGAGVHAGELGALGIGGRTAVLSVVTVVALGVPVLLVRRGLAATAEAVAALALVLTVLDALALYLVAEPWAWGAAGYTAVAAALLSALWAGYGRAVRGLRAPLPAAVVLGQLPPVLAVVAFGGDGQAVAWALLATGAADALLALRVRSAAVGATAWTAAGVTSGCALLTAVEASLRGAWSPPCCCWRVPCWVSRSRGGSRVPGRWRARWWRRRRGQPRGRAAARGGARRVGVDRVRGVRGAAGGRGGRGAAARRVPQGVRRGLVWASAGLMGAGLLVAVPPLLLVQAARVPEVWSGAVPAGPAAVGPLAVWPAVVAVALVAGVLAWGAAVPAGAGGPGVRVAARCGALGLGALVVFALPVAAGLPYGVVLAVQVLVVAALLSAAVRPAPVVAGLGGAADAAVPAAGFGCAVAAASAVAVLGLATEAATLAVLGSLAVLFAGAAAVGGARRRLRAASACGAVAAAAGFVGAAGFAAGWRRTRWRWRCWWCPGGRRPSGPGCGVTRRARRWSGPVRRWVPWRWPCRRGGRGCWPWCWACRG
ncbi:hypothetical protein [Streptomyces sp. CC228A]|uniref:hypothetical protein n=1 Tax=Streptomyces sp. CC228A TaxID=2898186 RepID=UPI001F36E3EB|nr:hypothetical protein [Streptomyces sp. CC228A]